MFHVKHSLLISHGYHAVAYAYVKLICEFAKKA